jgi:integrase
MPKRLTDRAIASLEPAGTYFDTEVTGLACKVYSSGVKAFVFVWREQGRQRRTTLGRFPAWTIGKARSHASRMRLRADTGEAVVAERGGRVDDLIEQWRAVVKLTRRPGTVVGYELAIDNHIVPAFGKDEPKAITRNRVEQWHGEIAQRTPIQANRSLGVLSSFMSWLEHDHKIERNPCRGVRRRPDNQRHIFLDTDEIKAAHAVLISDNNRTAALAIRLALLTGARIGECLNLTSAQIDTSRKLWIKPAATTKQKRVHIVPLQAEALVIAKELLQLGLPDYESCKRAWKRARKIISRDDVRIHDLRHSRASALARNGASLMQIGRVLGHTAPATTQRYAHLVAVDLVDLIERTD